jgi:hypothetical protein
MFYYLLYNSSFSFIVDNRLFSTILYGSILYILTHAILNYCSIEILTIINHYFWIIYILDIISLVYGLYLVYINPAQKTFTSLQNAHHTSSNNLSVSFNLLKNKINTLLDRKNDLTITHIDTPQQTQPQSTQSFNLNNHQKINADNGQKLSTPISQLNKQKKNIIEQHLQNNIDINIPDIDMSSSASTPINLIRTRISNINQDGLESFPEPIINEDGYTESVVGSDLGSVMDLDDFEKSL